MRIAEVLYKLKKPWHFLKTGLARGLVSQIRYGFPARKLTIITVTGTDGKTTTAFLVYHLLKTAGIKVALVSTVGAFIGEEQIDTGFHVTSPQPDELHAFMARLRKEGYTHLVLETTSQGIYQYRTWGIYPTIAGLTNITNNEHLDYHITYENYLTSKVDILKKAKTAVINESDESYPKVKKLLKNSQAKVVTFSIANPLPNKVPSAIRERFSEPYNQLNARLAATICEELGIEAGDVITGLATFPSIIGRKQTIMAPQEFKVIIDFAHTPNALVSLLSQLRTELVQSRTGGKLIAIYGCAGLRDTTKRPIMGQIGAELADTVVFTAEDPRTENVWTIIRQMKEGIEHDHSKVVSVADRKEAIAFGLQHLAGKGDIVAVLGKGHEKSICYGKVEYPWSDYQAVKDALGIKE